MEFCPILPLVASERQKIMAKNYLKVLAIRFVQNERVFYTTAMSGKDLINYTKVDSWNPKSVTGKEGYQRIPGESRKKQIAAYYERPDSIMPLGGLLNARAVAKNGGKTYGTVLEFEPIIEQDSVAAGWLKIPESAWPLYIVDMQHRIGGLEYAVTQFEKEELNNYLLPVTIADGLTLLEEVDQFQTINTTQKRVKTDLARRLQVILSGDPTKKKALSEQGKLWEVRGTVVTNLLSRINRDNVWYRKIMPANGTSDEFPNTIIRETSFVTSLKPVLQMPYFGRLTDKQAVEYIAMYWNALAKLWPEAFGEPARYVIQKTPGVFSLHAIAPEVFELARDEGQINETSLGKALKSLGEKFDSAYWLGGEEGEGAGQFGGMKGFKLLAEVLREHLPVLS